MRIGLILYYILYTVIVSNIERKRTALLLLFAAKSKSLWGYQNT